MQGNKYRNIKSEYNGVVYDSKLEAKKAWELDLLLRAGEIRDLERQKKFILLDGFVNNKGEKVRPIFYVADFVFYDISKKIWVVMDTKSPATRTQVYKLKKKLFESKYKEYLFVEVMK